VGISVELDHEVDLELASLGKQMGKMATSDALWANPKYVWPNSEGKYDLCPQDQ